MEKNESAPAEEVDFEETKNEKTKRILAQVLAGTANGLLVLGLGVSISIATVQIASLSKGDDVIKLSKNELSWLGSICFIVQPFGSLLSGPIMEPIGRKKAMMAVNIPYIIAWLMLWQSQNLATLFIANAILGFGTGIMEAPSVTYIGEVCEPSVRGTLIAYSTVFTASGVFGAYFLGTVLPWRIASAVCLTFPIVSILMISVIPESPIWLLAKGRQEEALKALCWLRGWVEPSRVEKEYKELIRYNRQSIKCRQCRPDEVITVNCSHETETYLQRLKTTIFELFQKETLRPLITSILFFMLSTMTGLTAIKPNMVNIFKMFDIDEWASVGVGVLSILGSAIGVAVIKFTGKRPIVLTSLLASSLSIIFLGAYANKYIPYDASSYAMGNVTVTGAVPTTPIIFFTIFVLFNNIGIIPISWMLLSEIFPFKTRATAAGVAAASVYVMLAIVTKTYVNLEDSLHLYGSFYFYGIFTFIGLILFYFILPETENRSLGEIESDFSGEKLKIFANDCVSNGITKLCKGKERNKDDDSNEKDYNNVYYIDVAMPITERAYDNPEFNEYGRNVILDAANLKNTHEADTQKDKLNNIYVNKDDPHVY